MNFTKKALLFTLTILIFGCDSNESGYSNKKPHKEREISTDRIENLPNQSQQTRVDIKENNTIITSNSIEDESSQRDIEERVNSSNIQNDIDSQTQTQIIEPYPRPTVSNSSTEIKEPQNIDTVENEQNIKSKFLKMCDQIVDKEFFEVCYSYDLKVAKAVIYRLEGDLVNELNIKERPDFYEEEQIPKEYRAEYSDYTHSGYDRGHLAPDASFDWSIESLEATYSLANIIPQIPEVNRYGWADLEQYVRDQAVELGYVDVINVVEYKDSPERIGENQIAVSSGYYKILSNEDENYKECFYYKNEEPQSNNNNSVESHKVDCNSIR